MHARVQLSSTGIVTNFKTPSEPPVHTLVFAQNAARSLSTTLREPGVKDEDFRGRARTGADAQRHPSQLCRGTADTTQRLHLSLQLCPCDVTESDFGASSFEYRGEPGHTGQTREVEKEKRDGGIKLNKA